MVALRPSRRGARFTNAGKARRLHARPNKELAGQSKSALNRAMNYRTRPNRPVLGQTQLWPTLC
jgi:hypothetical protein